MAFPNGTTEYHSYASLLHTLKSLNKHTLYTYTQAELTNLRYHSSELVEVAETVGRQAQLANAAVELVGAIKRVALVGLQVVVFEVAPVFDQARLDVLVEHELREDLELLAQELEREIHL